MWKFQSLSAALLLHGLTIPIVSGLEAPVAYEVVFDATWNAGDFPGAFPGSAHFSPLVGGVHSEQVNFWAVGQLASPGIELMAEVGGTSTLVSEVEAAIAQGSASSTIRGSGLSGLPRTTSEIFTASETHSLATLVTMIAPSPDWFVGVSGLPLRNDQGWIGSQTVELFGYDAGTEEGLQFSTGNPPSSPHVPIGPIDNSPFAGLPALGTFTFTVQPNGLAGDFDLSGEVDELDGLIWQRHFGQHQDGSALVVDGDADDDRDNDGRDLLAWQQHVGQSLGPQIRSVPEPSTMVAALLLASGLSIPNRRLSARADNRAQN